MIATRINLKKFFFARVGIDILFALSNQILMKILDFAFIANIEFDKLPPFFSSCKIIGHGISNANTS